jgi:hypothetical protein
VHGTISLRKELLIDGHHFKVKIPCVTIVGDAIALYPISQPLELDATCLVLRLPLHLTRLLVNQEVFCQLPRLLPDVTQPLEQLDDLEVWTLGFLRRSHQWILACKEVPEQPVLLLPSRHNDSRDPVIAMGGLLFLQLHLLDKLWTWCQAVDNVDSNHLKDVLVLEWLEFPSKDVAQLTSNAHHCLCVGVGSPIRDGKLCSLVALDVCNSRILTIHVGDQQHKGREPVH